MNFKWDTMNVCVAPGAGVLTIDQRKSRASRGRRKVIDAIDDPSRGELVDLIYGVLRSARGYRSLVSVNIGRVDGLPAAWFIGKPPRWNRPRVLITLQRRRICPGWATGLVTVRRFIPFYPATRPGRGYYLKAPSLWATTLTGLDLQFLVVPCTLWNWIIVCTQMNVEEELINGSWNEDEVWNALE